MKLLKTLLQVIAIFLPIFYWNFNVDTMSSQDGILNIFGGVVVAFLIDLGFKFLHHTKN